MNWWKVILASFATFAFIILGGILLGFSQMGDCYPEPAAYRECLAAKNRAWNILSAALIAAYLATIWLILRRRKAH